MGKIHIYKTQNHSNIIMVPLKVGEHTHLRGLKGWSYTPCPFISHATVHINRFKVHELGLLLKRQSWSICSNWGRTCLFISREEREWLWNNANLKGRCKWETLHLDHNREFEQVNNMFFFLSSNMYTLIESNTLQSAHACQNE